MPPDQQDLQALFRELSRRLVSSHLRPLWQRARERGLSMSQLFALRYIHHAPEANVSDLARALGVTSAATSQLLQRLVAQGYVRREENPLDRRNKRLRLTPSGERLLRDISLQQDSDLEIALSRLTPEETQHVLRAVEILLAKFPPLTGQPAHKPPTTEENPAP